MRTIKLQISASETHCEDQDGLCSFLKFGWPTPRCLAFTDGDNDLTMDTGHAGYKRLPECIAAEKEAVK